MTLRKTDGYFCFITPTLLMTISLIKTSTLPIYLSTAKTSPWRKKKSVIINYLPSSSLQNNKFIFCLTHLFIFHQQVKCILSWAGFLNCPPATWTAKVSSLDQACQRVTSGTSPLHRVVPRRDHHKCLRVESVVWLQCSFFFMQLNTSRLKKEPFSSEVQF